MVSLTLRNEFFFIIILFMRIYVSYSWAINPSFELGLQNSDVYASILVKFDLFLCGLWIDIKIRFHENKNYKLIL